MEEVRLRVWSICRQDPTTVDSKCPVAACQRPVGVTLVRPYVSVCDIHSVISEIATIDSSLRSTRYRATQSIPELRVWCVQLLFRTYAHVFTLPIFDDRCEYLATLSDGS